MYLLYLDKSGTVPDPAQRLFVLAGIAVFERSAHWAEQAINQIAARFSSENPYAVEYAFEQLARRFAHFLQRLHDKN